MKPPVFDAAWSAEVQALWRHDMQEIWDPRIAPHVWNQYHNQLDTYLSIAGDEPLDILDVGCAQGTLALLLAERGHRVTAVDLRAEFLDYARSRYTHGDVRFLQANALEEKLPGEYDLVFANQLIEHLVYPLEFVRGLTSNLRGGARLVVTTPNAEYFRSSLPTFRQIGDPAQWAGRQFSADADGHFYAYTETELVSVFEEAGLRRVESRFFETPMISGHVKVRHVHGFAPRALLRAADRLLLAAPPLARRAAHQLLVTGVRA